MQIKKLIVGDMKKAKNDILWSRILSIDELTKVEIIYRYKERQTV